ncbi:TraU family protein [Vibrio harveyi]|uniref:TraU family protein n=1 Tax=Vibrio harveyi TaxID=669 RepID=UPI003BB7FF85
MKIKFLFLLTLLFSGSSLAQCHSNFINPITDVSWKCIFPMRIAGMLTLGNGEEDPSTYTSPVCVCNAGKVPMIGLKTSFWEPRRMIDTVQDPYCMMPLGTSLQADSGRLAGSSSNNVDGKLFAQVHYYIFPAWQILNMFYDIPCVEDQGFDVAMLTEIMPSWNNEILSMIVNPEAILFANPVSAIVCGADVAAAAIAMPRNELFWCMGSWGNAYPLAGSITSTDFLEANAGIAARSIYMMGRLGMLWATSEDGCYVQPSPIWKKNRYKLQLSQPVKDHSCIPLGREGMLWNGGKHNLRNDNVGWIMFDKIDCCMRYK